MTDNIKPEHYRKGEIDLYEAWYRTYPFNEYRAIMQAVAERYMRRDKNDRVEDLDKAVETLKRLKEKEIEHDDKYKEIQTKDGKILAKKDLGLLRALQRSGYKYITRNKNSGLRAHSHLPLRIGDYWVSLGYFNRGCNIDLTQVEWAENKVIEISDLLATYENGGENGK